MFPKEITQFSKGFQRSACKKARQAETIWQQGKPSEHLKLDLSMSPCQMQVCLGRMHHTGQDGDQRSSTHASKKSIGLLRFHLVCPVSHKCLVSGMSKPHRGMQKEGFFQLAGDLLPLSCALGQHATLKENPHPKNLSQQLHTETTFCDCAMCYSTSTTAPLLPSLLCPPPPPGVFFSRVPDAPEGLG